VVQVAVWLTVLTDVMNELAVAISMALDCLGHCSSREPAKRTQCQIPDDLQLSLCLWNMRDNVWTLHVPSVDRTPHRLQT
jgi:hypothetical protein